MVGETSCCKESGPGSKGCTEGGLWDFFNSRTLLGCTDLPTRGFGGTPSEVLSSHIYADVRMPMTHTLTKAVGSGIADDPLWLKDKGNEFFKMGNFQSAINAFTAAVTLDPNMAPLYSNRAAAHMKMSDFHACAQDCSKAISLLTPPVEDNKRSRLIAYSRRAAALSALEDYESAINDIQQAIALNPDNESLADDLKTLQQKSSESNTGSTSFASDSLPFNLKGLGVFFFGGVNLNTMMGYPLPLPLPSIIVLSRRVATVYLC